MLSAARVGALALAVAAWATVATVIVDWSGLLPRAGAAAVAAAHPGDDPCALRLPLPAGNESRCDFPLRRSGGPPLLVQLDQTWESVTPQALVQRLQVRAAAEGPPLLAIEARTGLVPITNRILRVGVIAIASGEDHLVYVTGVCGNPACGTNDAVVVGWSGGALTELLRVRLGSTADIETRDGGVTTFEGAGAAPLGRTSPRVARSYTWSKGRYLATATAEVPTPSPARP